MGSKLLLSLALSRSHTYGFASSLALLLFRQEKPLVVVNKAAVGTSSARLNNEASRVRLRRIDAHMSLLYGTILAHTGVHACAVRLHRRSD